MRPEKKLLLKEIQDKVEGASSVFIAQYQGLSAADAEALRSLIASKGGDLEVVRKRVLLKATEAAGMSFTLDEIPGHIGVIHTKEDAIELAKAVYDFRKEHKDSLSVLTAYVDSQKLTGQEVETLSKLPGKQELRAQILGLFEAPMAQTVSVMDAILTSILHCMDNKSAKEEEN